MITADLDEASPALSPEVAEEMKKYGITRVPVYYYYYGKYRYTNPEDAIAEAKRDRMRK